jgi:biopolymer transport protein ExbD
MRYPRNVKIFRGGVDAAPFAGLFFATMLFMVLFHSHVFFPGVPIAFSDGEEPAALSDRGIEVLADRSVRFLGKVFDPAAFREELKERAKLGDMPDRVVLASEPGAPEEAVARVENLLTEAGVQIKLPGGRLDLPEDAGFAGVPNPVVVVGVNLNGQIFFQHQKIQESALELRLTEAVEKAGAPLTMVLQADKNLPLGKATELTRIARKAGIAQVVLGTRPGIL